MRIVSDRRTMDPRAGLPSVSRLLHHDRVAARVQKHGRAPVVRALRESLGAARAGLQQGGALATAEEVVQAAIARLEEAERPAVRRAVNATGIILHTGLGRSSLADAAREAAESAFGHCVLEIDEQTGRRGSRQRAVRGLLCELTGAESALVVNNNAAAVLLAVAALAAGREAVVSRGELVEIGGAFRMPDIIAAGGARLVEVGTTNRTRCSDYAQAIGEATALIVRCHPSNFRIVGFSEAPPVRELADLASKCGVPLLNDVGSGAILTPQSQGLAPVETLRDAVASTPGGLVTASGDKLLGGPQCGLILGPSALVDRLARHALARAVRIDKLTLAALEATLRLYRDPALARRAIPTLRYIERTEIETARLARRLRRVVVAALNGADGVSLASATSEVGGGSLPGEQLPTTCVRVDPRCFGLDEATLAMRLRRGDPAVFGRTRDGYVWLDPRTMEPNEFAFVARALREATRPPGPAE